MNFERCIHGLHKPYCVRCSKTTTYHQNDESLGKEYEDYLDEVEQTLPIDDSDTE